MDGVYVVYNFIHDHSCGGAKEDIDIYSDYNEAKNKYDCLRKQYIFDVIRDCRSYITEGNDCIRYDDHEYSVKIGIRKLLIK